MDVRTPWSTERTMEDTDTTELNAVNDGSPFSADTKSAFKSTEETMAELRRENFRLRLILYDYQKAKKRLIDPQDAESSRLFAAEAENLSLKEALIEKSDLIRSASKMIDILKAENDSFKEQLKEARERMEQHEREWRKKYDEVYAELVEVRGTLHISDLKARAQEHQVARQTGELQSQVAELQFTVDAGRTEIDRKTRELESVQADVSKLRSVLEQLSEGQPGEDGLQHSVNELSHSLHESCVKRIQELASLLHLLIRQITDAGLTPVATIPLDLSLNLDQIDRKPLGELAAVYNQPVPTNQQTSKGSTTDEDVRDAEVPSTDVASSVSWLTDRLNAARQLILDLGNQRLKQDACISQLKLTHRSELDALKENCRSMEEQLHKQKVSFEAEATKRNEEIHNLNQRVADLLGQAENEMKMRGKLLADVDQAQEQARRLECEKTEVRERLTAELREKEHVIQRLQLVLAVVSSNGDVTQHTIPNQTCMLDSFGPDAGAREETGKLLCGLSPKLQTSADGDGGSFMQHILLSSAGAPEATDVDRSGDHPPRSIESATFNLDVASGSDKANNQDGQNTSSKEASDQLVPDDIQGLQRELTTVRQQLDKQKEEYARLKNAYNILATATNIGSLASEAITSFDVTHDLGQLSNSSSLAESMGDLPTVSTPPCVSRSPVFDETSNLDELVANRDAGGSAEDLSDRDVSGTALDVGKAQTANDSIAPPNISTSLILPSRTRAASGLSASCVGQPLSVETVLNLSLPGVLDPDSQDVRRLPHNSPAIFDGQATPRFEPQSLSGLRTLYSLIHGLKLQLDEVRFTQHSFVEMVNRSLSAVVLDNSTNSFPENITESHKNVGIGTSFLFPSDCQKETPKTSVGNSSVQMSKADATYGGNETILENLQRSFLMRPDSDVDLDKSSTSVSNVNKTLGELRAYPRSPGRPFCPPHQTNQPHGNAPRIASILKSKNPLARLKATCQAASVSWCDDAPTQPAVEVPYPLSVSFNVDDRSDSSRPSSRIGLEQSVIGNLSLVEWQNKELFERLARATAKLRDALDECVEASSQLWGGETEKSLAKLFHNTLEISRRDEDHGDNKTPEPSRAADWNTSNLAPNQSVQFDGLHPHLDSARMSNDVSFSQLFGPAWPAAPDSSFSEKTDQKVSADTQTVTSKPCTTSTTATSTTTTAQAFTDPTDVVMLHRYVALLTHALSVLRRTISDSMQRHATSSSEAPTPDVDPHWLVSWVQSATHWFHSYMDNETVSDRSKGTVDSVAAADKDDVESLLECLERVFNDRIDDWVRDTKQHFTELAAAQKKNEELLITVNRLEGEVEQLYEEKQLAKNDCEDLRRQLASLPVEQDPNFHAASDFPQYSADKGDQQSVFGRLGRIFNVGQSKLASTVASPKSDVVEGSCPGSAVWNAALQKERDTLLNLLQSHGFVVEPSGSLSSCVESILTDLKETHNQCSQLSKKLIDFVPRSEYDQVNDAVQGLRTRLDQIERQRAYIKQRIGLLNFEVDPNDFTDCVDLLLSELSSLRGSYQQLTRENSHLLNKLDSSVSKKDYVECQNRVDELLKELRQLQNGAEVDCHVVERAVSILAPLAPTPVEPYLPDLVEWIVHELTEQRSTVDQLRRDKNQAVSLVSALCETDSPMTFSECFDLLRRKWIETQANLNALIAEREKVFLVLKDIQPDYGAQSLLDCIKSLVSSLTQKQHDLEAMREYYAKNSVPSVEHAKLQSDLEFVCDELEQCRRAADELEAERNELLRSSVPLEEHQELLQQLSDLEKRMVENKHAFDAQQRQIRHILSGAIAVDPKENDVVRYVEVLCEQLAEQRQLIASLEARYNKVVTDCENLRQQVAEGVAELDKRSARLKHEYENQMNATRMELEGKLSQCLLENEKSASELGEYRENLRNLNSLLEARQAESDCLLEQLAEMEEELQSVRSSLKAKSESAQAAVEAASAHEERANALQSQLDCLRTEHAHCMTRPATVNTQTSPVGKSKSTEDVNMGYAMRAPRPDFTETTDQQSVARSRKYGELKAVAFEIKEKLVHRTNKLESALTEVARLRSVIQQDKEHASRVLEEVEDLRKQAVRKNRMIRELETEVARLRALISNSGYPQPVINAPDTHSSARTPSQREQPRGAHCRVTMDGSLTSSFHASLLQHPDTPSINDPEFERDLSVVNASLTTSAMNSPDLFPEREAVPAERSTSPPCKRCKQLCHVAVNLQRLSSELQRRVNVDLDEELSLLDTLERQTVPTQITTSPALSQMPTQNRDASAQVSMTSALSSSMDELKVNIQSLHHARSRLQHYAKEVDRICSILVRRSHDTGDSASPRNVSNAELEVATGMISRNFDSLARIRRRLKSFFREMNLSHNATGTKILADLRAVIEDLGTNDSSLASASKSSEHLGGKENVAPKIIRSSDGLPDSLSNQAQVYRRQFRELARGLDSMAKDLTQTTNVLRATRTNLERTTGLSVPDVSPIPVMKRPSSRTT
ncbi:hypothetical protein CRM22_006389 [Opisthorchis felineus]|uniref:DUF5741 domain-containing protein n=1 Tax=Opisthorchis felineus TaxID=147828 RepID=A0A4V3SEF7_OPIFE|nr:hypothetical protein CRM22_006389 [Opisthorchis felineus]